jgi:predicted nucleic acid-binding Zn ribbon protein
VKREPRKLGDILPNIIQNLGQKTETEREITRAWAKAAGKKIASHTRPVYIKEARLFVETDSSSWTHTAMMQRHIILDKLNQILGEAKVRNIIFRSSGTNK